MDDDVQAIDTISHLNGGAISFVVPDPDTSGIPGALLRAASQQQVPQSKYAQLLAVIEDMGKDIRPTYAGSKSSAERLKRGIVHARILSWDTQLYADCVEFCPFEPYQTLAVCGTYQLCESEAARVGRLSLHSIDTEKKIDLTPDQLIDCPGILDVKWCRKKVGDGRIVFASANALGQIVLYAIEPDECDLLVQQHVESIGSNCLALSCDWYDGSKIVVSDSNGQVSCLSVDSQGGTAKLTSSWKAHDYEVWVASFDRFSDQLVYSGGDDSCFRLWDLRDLSNPITVNKKAHQMGVTSIESSPVDPNLLATGSYDERLLLWDKRQMKTWTSETSLGGGVWKLKWEPGSGRHLLAATMHNGFHILDCVEAQKPVIVTTYRGHSSLAYGCDWSRQTTTSSNKIVATCSFYDHCLQVWAWEP